MKTPSKTKKTTKTTKSTSLSTRPLRKSTDTTKGTKSSAAKKQPMASSGGSSTAHVASDTTPTNMKDTPMDNQTPASTTKRKLESETQQSSLKQFISPSPPSKEPVANKHNSPPSSSASTSSAASTVKKLKKDPTTTPAVLGKLVKTDDVFSSPINLLPKFEKNIPSSITSTTTSTSAFPTTIDDAAKALLSGSKVAVQGTPEQASAMDLFILITNCGGSVVNVINDDTTHLVLCSISKIDIEAIVKDAPSDMKAYTEDQFYALINNASSSKSTSTSIKVKQELLAEDKKYKTGNSGQTEDNAINLDDDGDDGNSNQPKSNDTVAASKKTPCILPSPVPNCLKDMHFVFTGEPQCCTRDEIEELVKNCGAVIRQTITKYTNYLIMGGEMITGKNPTEGKKYLSAKQKINDGSNKKIKIWTEYELYGYLRSFSTSGSKAQQSIVLHQSKEIVEVDSSEDESTSHQSNSSSNKTSDDNSSISSKANSISDGIEKLGMGDTEDMDDEEPIATTTTIQTSILSYSDAAKKPAAANKTDDGLSRLEKIQALKEKGLLQAAATECFREHYTRCTVVIATPISILTKESYYHNHLGNLLELIRLKGDENAVILPYLNTEKNPRVLQTKEQFISSECLF